jgi:glycogen operon protein
VNFVTAHDGFTLRDTVSYVHRHNEANGEDNRDGHSSNYSSNFGIEGDTDDEAINRQRRRQRLNLLATLMMSQGTPMVLAGDEFGNSQNGNNNAYAQDNETGWLDWSGLESDPQFTEQVRELVWLRREIPLLRLQQFVHGELELPDGLVRVDWINQEGQMRLSRTGVKNDWRVVFCSAAEGFDLNGGRTVTVPEQSIALLVAE